MRGAYCLVIRMDKDKDIRIGSLGNIHFPKGYYVYVGSAMNSLETRIARHLRTEKKKHWHIDYLLDEADVVDVLKIPSEKRIECDVAKFFASYGRPIPRFGSSDCDCESHLFYFPKKPELEVVFE